MTTTTNEMSLLPAALRLAEERGMEIPNDCNFGMRVVTPSFYSTHGFRWPFPGNWAEAQGPFLDHASACPKGIGDGLCVGLSWGGMASGGLPADLVLLVAYRPNDVLGIESDTKLRAKRAFVVDALTVHELLEERAENERADLRRANLQGANLQDANLQGANLRHADLRGADLRHADLRRVNLRHADLRDADLRDADLRDVNLRYADLQGAIGAPDA